MTYTQPSDFTAYREAVEVALGQPITYEEAWGMFNTTRDPSRAAAIIAFMRGLQ